MSLITPINKIIPLSTVDGPGARTAIFLQGCNIGCLYCHNPETQKICVNCGICVEGCPAKALSIINGTVEWDEKICVNCDNCIKVCPNYSSPKISWMTPSEAIAEIKKSIPFIRGITVSGGEAMIYPEFVTELFSLAKENGLDCLIDHNGSCKLWEYPELMSVCDGVMIDVKAWDSRVYKKLTGNDYSRTMKANLVYLADCGKLEEIRIVYEQHYVDGEAAIVGIKELLGERVEQIKLKLIAFRNNGVVGEMEKTKSPTLDEMKTLEKLSIKCGFKNIRIL